MPDFGDGSPREQYGQADPNAPSVANGQISPEQWAQYQARRRRDFILGMLGVAGGMVGAQPLVNAMGIGSAGAGAVSGSASVPGAVGATAAPLGGGTVTAGTLAATPFTSLAPYAGTVAGTGAGMTGAGAGAAGLAAEEGARRYLGLTPREWLAIGGTGVGAIGALTADRPNTSPNTTTSDPNIQRLLQSMQRRIDMSEPLYGSIMSMANGLLPTQYQNGGRGGAGDGSPAGNMLDGGLMDLVRQMAPNGDLRKGGGGMG